MEEAAVGLVLYQRRGCHLCEDMERELLRLAEGGTIRLTSVDVDSDPGLRARYGDRVPVLEGGGGDEICHYFLDRERLDRYLRAL